MSEKPRRSEVALALGTIIVLAAGMEASADPIRFDNPSGEGHFMWPPPVGEPAIALDFRLPAEEQPGAWPGLTSVRQILQANRGALMTDSPLALMTGVGSPDSFFLVGVDFGEMIPAAGTSWREGTCYQWSDGVFPPTGSLLPEGVPVYLGVRFDVGDGEQYGWIGVVRGGDHPGQLDAFAWGYETEPGVSIAAGAPEPGTLAVLVLGGVVLAGCRRRRPVEL